MTGIMRSNLSLVQGGKALMNAIIFRNIQQAPAAAAPQLPLYRQQLLQQASNLVLHLMGGSGRGARS
jgi:hypothetical protein